MTPEEALAISEEGGVSAWAVNGGRALAIMSLGSPGLASWDAACRIREACGVAEGFEAMGRYLALHADFARWCEVNGR